MIAVNGGFESLLTMSAFRIYRACTYHTSFRRCILTECDQNKVFVSFASARIWRRTGYDYLADG